MIDVVARAPEIVAATRRRTDEVVVALTGLDDAALLAPSPLPGWDRLTIACHLRFGAEALIRLTAGIVDGVPAAYYPGGRERERPTTLHQRPGEDPREVVASLSRSSTALHDLWEAVDRASWAGLLIEPADQTDLGAVSLAQLALLRLTEVEVHGVDLDVGVAEWSDSFVELALPARVDRLNVRRTNHRAVDAVVQGSWLLAATDGPSYRVSVEGERVTAEPAADDPSADATIQASSRDLLALLLGRPFEAQPAYSGDEELAGAFTRAFPGP